MYRRRAAVLFTFALLLFAPANAEPIDPSTIIRSGPAHRAKVDSVLVLGAPGTTEGRFETAGGAPDLQGWVPVDLTAEENYWHVTTQGVADLDPSVTGNHAWWCGTAFPTDCASGYGPYWDYSLDWYGTVPDPSSSLQLTVEAAAHISMLDSYHDVVTLQVENDAGGWLDINTYYGSTMNTWIIEQTVLNPNYYTGPGGDQVHLRWRFTSNGSIDDSDCLADSYGPIMLDLISVYFWPSGGFQYQVGTTETCEPGDLLQWIPMTMPGGAGNFGQVWETLDDVDPCATNSSPQVAFIDDGLVVPGTGGYTCQTWCYGPGGYVVNPDGGLLGSSQYIHSAVDSPVFPWPGGDFDGGIIEFDVYRHLPYRDPGNPGIAYQWYMRTAVAGEDIALSSWKSDGFIYFGGPEYHRFSFDMSGLIPEDTEEIQISLGARDVGWAMGLYGTDATPAPYFDNVRLVAFDNPGPSMYTLEKNLAQDGFPEQGQISLGDLARNSVRFDAAVNLSPRGALAIDPGDSLGILINELPGTTLDGPPSMHYKLFPNPLFDPVRSQIPPGAGNTAYEGVVECQLPQPPYDDGTRFHADLPDTGFFFPGDVVHYYFRAVDTGAGVSVLPADTTGFSVIPTGEVGLDDFYDPLFTVRALPTLHSTTVGDQATILLWDDSGSDEELDAWLSGLSGLPLELGLDYDLYVTRAPHSGEANGLGARAAYGSMVGYETILYTAGVQEEFTISPPDPEGDLGNDTGTLESWLYGDGRTLLLMGDNLVSSMHAEGHVDSDRFLLQIMGAAWVADDVRPTIDGQTQPTVWPMPGDPIFDQDGWLADGGCPRVNTFDHIQATGGGVQSAEFLTAGGSGGAYPAAAAVTTPFPHATTTSEVITIPYGLAAIDEIQQLPKDGAKGFFPAGPLSFLYEVLDHAGHTVSGVTPPKPVLALTAHPNPFNPQTEFHYSLDVAGPVTLDLYDVRGRRVRKLIDEVRPAGGSVAVWDGHDDAGRGMSSGVYFAIMEAATGRRVMKVTILK